MRENWLVLTESMSFSICSFPEPAFAECIGCLSANTACVSMFRRVLDDPALNCHKWSQGTDDAPKVVPKAHECISLLSAVFTASPGNGTGFEFWLWPELQTNLPLFTQSWGEERKLMYGGEKKKQKQCS